MRLMIAKHTGDDVMRAVRRCRMELSRAIAEEFTADGHFAFASHDLPNLPNANCVELNAPLGAGQFERITEAFAQRGSRCLQWASPSIDDELVRRGAFVRKVEAMRLAGWSRAPEQSGTLTLQARAATAKFEQLLIDRFGAGTSDVEAGLALVDNPQDEWLIAMQSGRCLATAAVLTSGDAGLVHDCFALPGADLAGRELIDRVIEFAARAGLRHVVACVDFAEVASYKAAGFVAAGPLFDHRFR